MIESFKRGVATMSTRPFGEQFAEELLVRRYNLKRVNKNHDLEASNGDRIEAKFSRIFVKPTGSGVDYILKCGDKQFNSKDNKYQANFQKIHPNEFEELIYGVVFNEGIAIYRAKSSELHFNNQHLNNSDMKQLGISKSNESKHDKHLVEFLNWDTIIEVLS